jgi:MSHA pilin protein MshC
MPSAIFNDPGYIREPCMKQRGFTLIELIMVMLGVLAVFAAPRVFNRNDFEARGFHDQTLGLCGVHTNSLTLTIATTEAVTTCANPLNGPTGAATLTAQPT